MSPEFGGRLVVLSGPSCVGKSPLDKALGRFRPDLRAKLQKLVLYNTRAPRPGELDGRDYHFRTRQEVFALRRKKRFVVLDVRGDLQAMDMDEVLRLLNQGDVFFEGNPFVGCLLLTHRRLRRLPRLGVFLSPFSRAELTEFKALMPPAALRDLVTDVMRRKLLRRTRRQKGELSLPDLEGIERRAGSAYDELKEAWRFEHVIPNHDGEDSDHWDAFYHPIGDARKALQAFIQLLLNQQAEGVERWDKGLLD